MKRNIMLPILAMMVILLASPAFSQDSDEQEPTVEEQYLRGSDFQVVEELANSLDRSNKMLALDNIEQMLEEDGLVTGDPQAHLILEYLAMEGITRQVREGVRLINYFPEVRRRSAELLGRLGGRLSQETLIEILLADDEPMVLAEAAYALGEIANDPNDEAARAIARAVESQNIVSPDNNFAWAALLALENLATSGDGIQDPLVFRAVIHIAQGNYIRDVKLKAYDVLQILRGRTPDSE
ncbi:MAG: HEAT repeat domain-containing protein [Spirochaetia bacterium]